MPWYEWLNTFTGASEPFFNVTGAAGGAGGAPVVITANQDYYDYQTSGCSGTQTTGVCSGTLAARAANCTAGVGYWATDQGSWNVSGNGFGNGVFYQCTGNAWTAYYTPFTYPDPAEGISVVATPTFLPAAGTYSSTQNVTASDTTAGATLCYTLNGSTPTATVAGTCDSNGGVEFTYSSAISVPCSATVNAIGTLSGDLNSSVGSAAYVISNTVCAALSGTGISAAAVSTVWSGTVNAATVPLGSSPVTTTSAAQTVTICNGSISSGGVCTASSATLTISAMALSGVNSGDFSFATTPTGGNDCGGSLAAGATCTINFTLDPSLIGPESATFTMKDSASGSPQTFSITGTGISQVSFSPTNQAFGNQLINTASSELLTALTNNGSTTVTSLALSLTGASAGLYAIDTTSSTLSGLTNCAKITSLAASATCNAGVTFTPVAVGNNFLATLTFTDSAAGSPQTVPLTGNGIGTNLVVPSATSIFAVLRPLNLP